MNDADRKAFKEWYKKQIWGNASWEEGVFEGFEFGLEWRDCQVGEPVAWQFFCENEKRWFNGSELNNHRKNTEQAGYKLRNLYTIPPAAQINQQLVRALEEMSKEYLVPNSEDNPLNNMVKAALAAAKETK